ncbi:MAG TPA: zinc ribbon domain-containing protein [Candidatus Tyrphobacter sp.]|nr:zinc ribbon domain-containing protein [Candidatus Tyrphobacter sp.]
MPELPDSTCPVCHVALPANAYFCPNCGKALREKPPTVSVLDQMGVYLVSILLPPLGFWYTWKYLRFHDRKLATIGLAAAILTLISLVLSVWLGGKAINLLNQYVNQSLNLPNLGGLGGF